MLQLTITNKGNDTYESAFSFLNVSQEPEVFIFAQAANGLNLIPSSWILLGRQSTVSVFKNRALLSNIWPNPRALHVHTNDGMQLSTQMGHVKNLGDVWFNANSLANILSMRLKCARFVASPWTPLWNQPALIAQSRQPTTEARECYSWKSRPSYAYMRHEVSPSQGQRRPSILLSHS
jgi:hypothetical protein